MLSPLKELESRATGGVVSFETHWENSSSEVEKLKGVEVPGSLETCSNEAGGSSSGREYLPNAVRLTEGFDIEATKPQVMNIDAEYDKQISGVANRSYLEDMELETRALTEPLPTNQQVGSWMHLNEMVNMANISRSLPSIKYFDMLKYSALSFAIYVFGRPPI